MVFYLANGQKPKNKKGLLSVLFVLRCYSNVLFLYALKTTIILPDVRKTFDGTTSHSTRLSKNNSQVAGYGRAPVGAGHARNQAIRGHGPLLQTAHPKGALHQRRKNQPSRRLFIKMQTVNRSFQNQTAAGTARRIFAQRAARDVHVQRVQRQQLAAQAALDADQQLERFRRLQCADDTHQRCEHASGRAAQLGSQTVLGEQAVVARRLSLAKIEYRNLPVELDRRTRHQRFALAQTGTIDLITRGEIVAAIQHHIRLGDQIKQLRSIGTHVQRDALDFGIDVVQRGSCRDYLGLVHRGSAVDDLPLQVAEIHRVMVA